MMIIIQFDHPKKGRATLRLLKVIRDYRQVIVYTICQAAVLVWFYWPFLSGAQTFFIEDHTAFFEPLSRFIGQSLAKGHLPLWNPYAYCGMPEIAISSPGIFYPPNWLFAIMPYSQALGWIMIISQTVCGLGSFLLVACLGWGVLPAALAGVSMASSGYVFSLSNNYTLVATAAWFPLSLFSLIETTRSKAGKQRLLWLFTASGSIFMMIAGGRPEIFVPALLLLVGYCLIHDFGLSERSALLEPLKNQARAIGIGILLSMPILLPIFEWLPLSRRSEGLNAKETLLFSSNWYDLIDMLTSHPLGDLAMRGNDFRALILPDNLMPYISSTFISSALVALAVGGMVKGGKRFYWATISILIFSIVLALGSNIPFMDTLVNQVSVLSILRFPGKLLFFAIFCISLLAARGLNHYLNGTYKARLPIALSAGIVISGLALFFSDSIVLPFILPKATLPASLLANSQIAAQKLIGSGLAISGALALAAQGVLGLTRIKSFSGVGAGYLVVVLLCLIGHATKYHRSGGPQKFYQTSSLVASKIADSKLTDSKLTGSKLTGSELEEQGSLPHRSICLALQSPELPPQWRSADQKLSTMQSFQYLRQLLRPFTNIDFKNRSSFGYEGAMNGEYYYFMLNSYFKSSQAIPEKDSTALRQDTNAARPTDVILARLLQLTSTGYVITQDYRSLPQPGAPHHLKSTDIPLLDKDLFEMIGRYRELNLRIYAVKHSLPHAYLSFAWRSRSSRDVLLREIFNQGTDFDPAKLTLIESTQSDLQTRIPTEPLEMFPEPITEQTPELLSTTITTASPAILVLTDQFYPGWTARVDGKEEPIIRCNGFMRGVFVADGKHTVEFSYNPRSLIYGLVLAALAVLWALIVVAQEFSGSRKS